jgi:protein phosphatase
MDAWWITDRGLVRKQNEDSCCVTINKKLGIALGVVCDGMGGARAGNIASSMAMNSFSDNVTPELRPDSTAKELTEIMRTALGKANRSVYEKGISNAEFFGMGTTIVAAAISNNAAVVLNVGDSRAYKISGGEIKRITKDHSVVEEMVDRGDITREEARHHPNRNIITRALGTAPTMKCDIFETELNEGDFLLLCSDGLTNTVEESDILNEVTNSGDHAQCCDRLLSMSYAHGASDNVTIVLLKR